MQEKKNGQGFDKTPYVLEKSKYLLFFPPYINDFDHCGMVHVDLCHVG